MIDVLQGTLEFLILRTLAWGPQHGFGIAKWIFQDGVGHSLLGFEPQGFLDAWGPVFFFAMIFAISMDYTVFLLSSAKELSAESNRLKGEVSKFLATVRAA